MHLVEIINVGSSVGYLSLSDDPKETIIIPAKGRLTKKLDSAQLEKLKKTAFKYRIIG
jgi:hypothetical protein